MGARESLNRRKNMARRKVKNSEKSPWGQRLTRPVTKGRCRSDFWLVPENFCVFLYCVILVYVRYSICYGKNILLWLPHLCKFAADIPSSTEWSVPVADQLKIQNNTPNCTNQLENIERQINFDMTGSLQVTFIKYRSCETESIIGLSLQLCRSLVCR